MPNLDLHLASVRFLRVDLELGRTFAKLARREGDLLARSRLRAKAENAHDAVVRLLSGIAATEDERVEIELGLTSLHRAIREI